MDDIQILRCPVSRQVLRRLTADERAELNLEIREGRRVHGDGSAIRTGSADDAVATEDLRYVYRVEDGIFVLLPALAIVRGTEGKLAGLDADKQLVQSFYDEFGWLENDKGEFLDSEVFTAEDGVAKAYAARANKRVAAQLKGGSYLLDAASGAIPSEGCRVLSAAYTKRVCLDFSMLALRQARRKLGPGKGVFVLGDITALPIATGAIDDAISLHTLYHVPKPLQTTAVDELVRSLKPGGRLVVAYTWGASPLMRLAKRLLAPFARQETAGPGVEKPALYFHPQGKEWFRALRDRYPGSKLKVANVADLEFQKSFFRSTPLGRLMSLGTVMFETALEPIAARYGQYPLFVIPKPAR